MRLDELKTPKGSKRSGKRLGRGPGSGKGKTAGKGHKGQKARSGGVKGPGFEGGQMPLTRRVPKRGFVNIFRKRYEVVNVGRLVEFDEKSVVTPQLLKEKGLVHGSEGRVKILGDGELKVALTVQAHAFSKGALEKISSVGGKAEVI